VSFDERALIEHVTQQRWYGAKSRGVAHSQVLDSVVVRATEPQLALALVEMRYETGAHDVYQLLYSVHDGEVEIDDDVALACALFDALRTGTTLRGDEGTVEFHSVKGFATRASSMARACAIDVEQSNTSVVFDDEAILKVFRRLEPGVNPELEVLRFLTEHDFSNAPPLGGWYAYAGGRLGATLGILQAFVREGTDGWELARHDLMAILPRLRRLGEVTAALHTVLASDQGDPAFAAETPSVEMLGLLTATVDEEIERVFLELPQDAEELAPIAGRGEEVREQLRSLTQGGSIGKIIRVHGDYHLGQTLWADGDWVIIDFEGEPARTFAERRRKRSPLRDVAGMLRSFAYAARSAEMRGATVPETWEADARAQFLEGYLATVDPSLLPPGAGAIERLLSVFELEKAVYELRYELDNRPDWVGIPVLGIQRLIDAPGSS
jgi:predicted trehalose synthase